MISIFYLHRAKYFCLHSQGKYFHFSVLTNIFVPGNLPLTSEGPGSRPSVTGPRVETRVDRGVTGDGAGAIGGHGVMMVCCDRPGFNRDVSRINTEITSLALILVMATTVYSFVAILGRDTLLWYCQDYSAYQSYEIGANICPALDICDHLFPSNKQRQHSHEPGQCVQSLHIPKLQFMA